MLNNFLLSSSWNGYVDIIEQLKNAIGSKKPVLYGYQGEGYYLRWFLDKYSGPYSWTIVDDRDYIFDCGIVKPIEIALGLIDTNQSILIVAKKITDEVKNNINLMGYYRDGDNVIVLSELFQARSPFYAWIEDVRGVDFLIEKKLYDENEMFKNYSPITERAIVSIEEVIADSIAVLDIGSGKGAAAAYFASCGKHVGLAEYDKKLLEISKRNFEKLHLTGTWYEGDASFLCEELDEWDCFYLYNPFVGKPFYDLITSIKKSIVRNPRKIVIAYGNPYEGRMLSNMGFNLKQRVITDCSCRYWNIYSLS